MRNCVRNSSGRHRRHRLEVRMKGRPAHTRHVGHLVDAAVARVARPQPDDGVRDLVLATVAAGHAAHDAVARARQ